MVSLMQKRRKLKEFEEDDSNFEDLLADEYSASGNVSFNDIAWSKDNNSEVEVPAFTEQVGPSVQLQHTTTALDYFKLLFMADLITTTVNNRNNYSMEKILDSEEKGKDIEASDKTRLYLYYQNT